MASPRVEAEKRVMIAAVNEHGGGGMRAVSDAAGMSQTQVVTAAKTRRRVMLHKLTGFFCFLVVSTNSSVARKVESFGEGGER